MKKEISYQNSVENINKEACGLHEEIKKLLEENKILKGKLETQDKAIKLSKDYKIAEIMVEEHKRLRAENDNLNERLRVNKEIISNLILGVMRIRMDANPILGIAHIDELHKHNFKCIDIARLCNKTRREVMEAVAEVERIKKEINEEV